jgi:SAM-dependent methyltransferase
MVLGWSSLHEGYEAFAQLRESVMTGRSGFELRFGQQFHQYLDAHPDRAAAYLAAMDSTIEGFQAAVDSYDFSKLRTVLDVGGGGGAFLTCLIRSYPQIRGVLFEVPSMIERVSIPGDVADRIELVAGDAADVLPAGADAYVFCTVLRCFSDEQAIQVLARCRQAMHRESKILACEMVMPEGAPEPMRGLADLQALTLYGGADRNRTRWEELIDSAGLRLDEIKEADPPYSWIVASVSKPIQATPQSQPAPIPE